MIRTEKKGVSDTISYLSLESSNPFAMIYPAMTSRMLEKSIGSVG